MCVTLTGGYAKGLMPETPDEVIAFYTEVGADHITVPIAYNIQFKNVLQGSEIENIHPVQCELFCEIGSGFLPLQAIIDLAGEIGGIPYVFLKQDYTRYPSEFESVAASAANYRRQTGF